MTILDVNYFQQEHQDGCALGAFHMVYNFLRPNKVSVFKQKQKTFLALSESDPHAGNRRRITTDKLVSYANQRGFCSGWGRVSPQKEIMKDQLRHFLADLSLPLIVCQRYTEAEPNVGHFRVVTGLEGDNVIFHDPDPDTGGASLSWTIAKFADYWKQSGRNVTGRVAVWVANQSIDHGLLLD